MINIHQLLAGLVQACCAADFPDEITIATALDLDISQATITKSKLRTVCINGARLNGSAVEVGVVCGITPRRSLWLVFHSSSVPYGDVKNETFGAYQRIDPSKLGAGFSVLFDIDGLTCGFTVPSADGTVHSLFCEEPKAAVTSASEAQIAPTLPQSDQ